jgi:hypothetical protein
MEKPTEILSSLLIYARDKSPQTFENDCCKARLRNAVPLQAEITSLALFCVISPEIAKLSRKEILTPDK